MSHTALTSTQICMNRCRYKLIFFIEGGVNQCSDASAYFYGFALFWRLSTSVHYTMRVTVQSNY